MNMQPDTPNNQDIRLFRPPLRLLFVLALMPMFLFLVFVAWVLNVDAPVVELVIGIGAIILTIYIAGQFPAIFVALLQGGMGILIYVAEPFGLTIPDGITILAFAGLSLIGMVVNLVRNSARINIFVRPAAQLTFALSLLIVISVAYSWHEDALTKAGLFVTVNLVSFSVATTLSPEQRRQLYVVLLIVGLLVAGGIMTNFVLGNRGAIAGRYQGFGLDVISGARLVGLAIIILLYSPLRLRLRFVLITLLTPGLLLAGTRGPLLALIATIIFTPFLLGAPSMISSISKRSLVLIFAVLLGLVGVLYFAINNPSLIIVNDWGPLRIISSTNLQDENVISRLDHIKLAMTEFAEKPLLGWGIAGYGGTEPYSSPVVFNWPHNLTFEVLVELGIVGFLLLVIALLGTYLSARRVFQLSQVINNNYVQQEVLLVVLILTYALINAHISGMLHINRTIWLGMGLIQGLLFETPRMPIVRRRRWVSNSVETATTLKRHPLLAK
jgi:O-antigen ligase